MRVSPVSPVDAFSFKHPVNGATLQRAVDDGFRTITHVVFYQSERQTPPS